MDIAVIAGAVVMGLSLGLLGSGGSILTVPLLVYVAGEPEKLAIAESLIIVGLVAAVGAWRSISKQNADVGLAVRFGLPSMAAAVLGAWASQFVSGTTQLLVFSLVMLAAAVMMLRGTGKQAATTQQTQLASPSLFKGLLSGSGVGMLAGFVGVGGGFLIVPVLLKVLRVPLSLAVGTSLIIICMQSLAAALKYQYQFSVQQVDINWTLVSVVGSVAILGVLAGGRLVDTLPQAIIKRMFAICLLGIGLFTVIETTLDIMRNVS